MPGLFDSTRMAEGYANARPELHSRIVERIGAHLGRNFEKALDVGCGAGRSTEALGPVAGCAIGIDPSFEMIRAARGGSFVVAQAESIPLASETVDLITAAGSLNWADLSRFFPEARRVLRTNGVLVIYDFSEGKSCREATPLADWYNEFLSRYPSPPCQDIDPRNLDLGPFELTHYDPFELDLPMSREAYLEYVLTETNVEAATEPLQEIRAWCESTLPSPPAPLTILFQGFIGYLA